MPKRTANDVARLITPEFLHSIKRLDLRAKTLVEGLLAGRHAAPRHGFSVEFSDYREYAPGDDINHIDWRVFLRTDQYYVKRFQAETNLRCTIVVDASASMDYASPGAAMSKFEYAQSIAAAFSLILTRQRDRVGLMVLRDSIVSHIPPRSRRAHLNRIFEVLGRTRAEGRGQIGTGLGAVARSLKRRGLVIVLSDFLPSVPPAPSSGEDDIDRACREVGHLSFRGHDVILFQVLDPAELVLPFERSAVFVDPETGVEVSTNPARIRDAYCAAMKGLVDRVAGAAQRHGAEHRMLTTAMPFDRALARFLALRKNRA